MAKKKYELGWDNIEELVYRMIDFHPRVDPSKLGLRAIEEMVSKLPGIAATKKRPQESLVEELRTRWEEERADMEDELGPFDSFSEDSELDEDVYREDRLATAEDDDEDDDDDRDRLTYHDEFDEEEEGDDL